MSNNEIRKRRRTAPDAAIITGVWWTDTANLLEEYLENGAVYHGDRGGPIVPWAFAYLMAGVASIPAAREALKEAQKGLRPTYKGFSPAGGNFHATNACQRLAGIVGDENPSRVELRLVMEEIRMGHEAHAGMMDELGYDEITEKDQARIRKEYNVGGGGGGR